MDKALIFHKEDLSKKDDIADLILACILYGDKKKGADYAQALKACMEREDKSGKGCVSEISEASDRTRISGGILYGHR